MTADRTLFRALAMQAELIRAGNSFGPGRAEHFAEVIETFATAPDQTPTPADTVTLRAARR